MESMDDSNYSDGSSRGARVPPPPLPTFLFLDQTLGPKVPKKFFLDTPTPLRQGLDWALNYTSSTTLSYGTVGTRWVKLTL